MRTARSPIAWVMICQPRASARRTDRLRSSGAMFGAPASFRLAYGASIAAGRGPLAFGSDWPVVSLNPMLGIHTAVNRTSPDGVPEGGWHPEQKLTLKAAVNAYTSASAWASFDEQRKGTLTPGMLADIVILSDDIFSAKADPATLAATRAVVTVFDGKVVYRRDRASTN